MTITQVKESLIGMSHSGTLNKVRNLEALLQRAGNTMLAKLDPLETERTIPLAQVIHDDLNNYPLPSDFKKPIALTPQANASNLDSARRLTAEPFDLTRALANRTISIEASEGQKFMRVNWKAKGGIVLNRMETLTDNGTWSAVGAATGLKANNIYYLSGNGSIEFDVVASGDGIKNTTQEAIDLSDWDELADIIFPVFIGDVTNLTSLQPVFGNDLTTKYWTCVAQTTQADGTAFRNGWNWIKASWATATETGTVDPATIDSFKLVVNSVGAISNIRVDNIIFSLGRAFDFKYYSKYFIKNTAGVWLDRTTSDDDIVVFGDDCINIYLFECLDAIAQQAEGEDSAFDIEYAGRKLNGDPSSVDQRERAGLYAIYRAEYPSMSKKAVQKYSGGPRFRR